jgi:hypothetical protein
MSTPKSTRTGRPSTCAPRGVVATPGHDDAVAEGVKKVVLTFAVFGPDAKALDLVEQMVTRMIFVGGGFMKRRCRIFDAAKRSPTDPGAPAPKPQRTAPDGTSGSLLAFRSSRNLALRSHCECEIDFTA